MEQSKKQIAIFIWSKSEEEFIRRLIEHLENKKNKSINFHIDYCRISESFNAYDYESISKNILFENEKCTKEYVFCFYDYYIYEKPEKLNYLIDWKEFIQHLKKCNIAVYEIKAINSIEDWFLYDFEGLCKYLKINQVNESEFKDIDNGIEKMKFLFKKAQNIYNKDCDYDFIRFLNFNIIYEKLKSNFNFLIDVLFGD